jgi:hypothetical protein
MVFCFDKKESAHQTAEVCIYTGKTSGLSGSNQITYLLYTRSDPIKCKETELLCVDDTFRSLVHVILIWKPQAARNSL